MSGAESNAEHTLYIVIISCIATIGGFLFGFDSGVINGTVDGLRLPSIPTVLVRDLMSPPCYWGVPSARFSPAGSRTDSGVARSCESEPCFSLSARGARG